MTFAARIVKPQNHLVLLVMFVALVVLESCSALSRESNRRHDPTGRIRQVVAEYNKTRGGDSAENDNAAPDNVEVEGAPEVNHVEGAQKSFLRLPSFLRGEDEQRKKPSANQEFLSLLAQRINSEIEKGKLLKLPKVGAKVTSRKEKENGDLTVEVEFNQGAFSKPVQDEVEEVYKRLQTEFWSSAEVKQLNAKHSKTYKHLRRSIEREWKKGLGRNQKATFTMRSGKSVIEESLREASKKYYVKFPLFEEANQFELRYPSEQSHEALTKDVDRAIRKAYGDSHSATIEQIDREIFERGVFGGLADAARGKNNYKKVSVTITPVQRGNLRRGGR